MRRSTLSVNRRRLTSQGRPVPHDAFMTHFLATVLAAFAAAAVFTLSIPSEAATVEWELPFPTTGR